MAARASPRLMGRLSWRPLTTRLARSAPSLGQVLLGSLVWAVAMAGSVYWGIGIGNWASPDKIGAVLTLYAAGAAIAFPLGFCLARLLSLGRSAETTLAAALLSFAAATVAVTALLFAVEYRSYYAEWHAPAGSLIWSFQLVFTAASALYQFAALGLRLFLPLGFLALLALAWWFAGLPR